MKKWYILDYCTTDGGRVIWATPCEESHNQQVRTMRVGSYKTEVIETESEGGAIVKYVLGNAQIRQ